MIKRMLEGKPVIIHGDGTSLWTITYNEDFAKGFIGLMGNPHAIGEAFQITSDETLTWNQIHQIIADCLGVELKPYYVASEYLAAVSDYDLTGSLIGDKANSVVFDNSKVSDFTWTNCVIESRCESFSEFELFMSYNISGEYIFTGNKFIFASDGYVLWFGYNTDTCSHILIENNIFTGVGDQPNVAYCYPDHVALYNLAGAVATLDNLIDSTIPYFKELAHEQQLYRVYGDKVCIHLDGKSVKPAYVTRATSRFLKSCGFEDIRLHDLRHTAATLLASRVPLKHIQSFLGHESIETTANIYTHTLTADKINTAECLNEFLKSADFCSEFCSERFADW